MSKPQRRLPPLEWVRAFEATARCGSFTAAAAETGLTQSAISQRISQLERLLGTRLFERHARSISLTVDGENWLPHVTSALDTIHASSEAFFGEPKDKDHHFGQRVRDRFVAFAATVTDAVDLGRQDQLANYGHRGAGRPPR